MAAVQGAVVRSVADRGTRVNSPSCTYAPRYRPSTEQVNRARESNYAARSTTTTTTRARTTTARPRDFSQATHQCLLAFEADLAYARDEWEAGIGRYTRQHFGLSFDDCGNQWIDTPTVYSSYSGDEDGCGGLTDELVVRSAGGSPYLTARTESVREVCLYEERCDLLMELVGVTPPMDRTPPRGSPRSR